MQKQLIIITLIFLCVFTALPAIGRTEQKRLFQFNSEFVNAETGYSSTSLSTNYFQIDNPELLDSVNTLTIHTDNMGNTETTSSTKDYTGTIEFTGSLKQVSYYFENDDSPNFQNHYVYEMDNLGRTVHTYLEILNSGTNDVIPQIETYRHFNALGYADSLYCHYINTSYKSYCIRHFENSMLSYCIVYIYQNGQWSPYSKYVYSYEPEPYEFPEFIRFDNYANQTFSSGLIMREMIFNPKFLTGSIIEELWDGTNWVSDDTYSFSSQLSNDQICLSLVENNTGGETYIYVFNQAGDISIYNSAPHIVAMEFHIDFSWDVITASEDNVTIKPDIILAFPNPFTKELNIKRDSKSNSPADISIYNIKGQLIRQWKDSKATELVWDGKDMSNRPVSIGIYLIRSRQGNHSYSAKIIKL